jgi:hypothetical protein
VPSEERVMKELQNGTTDLESTRSFDPFFGSLVIVKYVLYYLGNNETVFSTCRKDIGEEESTCSGVGRPTYARQCTFRRHVVQAHQVAMDHRALHPAKIFECLPLQN